MNNNLSPLKRNGVSKDGRSLDVRTKLPSQAKIDILSKGLGQRSQSISDPKSRQAQKQANFHKNNFNKTTTMVFTDQDFRARLKKVKKGKDNR